jgi:hypothetical protein
MSWLRLAGMSRTASRRAKAALLLGLLLSVLGMATSPSLHKFVHPNATNPDHHCAATLLASGQVDAASSDFAIPAVLLVPIAANQAVVSTPSVPSFNLSLSRGPPALLS